MELNPGNSLHGFTVTDRSDLPEIDGEAIMSIHEKSGARLLYLKNDDNNKSFAIGFKTPPADDTGVFHILEHSVLCGSRKFPVKEPFVDLLKGSMQTFLNAMTFSDKTLYPVASTNEQDLFNLMDVYLDAVFHPLIYEKRQIFEQEGWHYEFEGETGPDADTATLAYNGVVFNEMKGALSDANSVLYDALQSGLFAESCYAFESGGKPAAITTLTYEGFLDEHRRHYRTDNSFIILYGNVDIDRALAFLDESYLTPVAEEQRASEIAPPPPRTIEFHDSCRGQARVPMRTAPENACAGVGYVIGSSHDRLRVLASDIMLDALFGSNEAPLKRRLLDMGIAHDIHAFVSDGLLQPFAVIQLQRPENKTAFSNSVVIENEVKKLLAEGLDHELIEAAISHEEFQMREHDFGIADGVVYAMTALSSWLYDDNAATDYLRYEDAFAELRQALDAGYFEELARELLCENDHVFSAEVVPNPDAYDGGLADGLAAAQDKLTPEAAERIDAEVALLREIQETPDSPEAIATLPHLHIADIGDAPVDSEYGIDDGAPIACLRHHLPTHGISYAYRYFDASCLAFDELPYLGILARVLGKLGTAKHSAAEIDTLIQGKLGNLGFFLDVFGNDEDISDVKPEFVVSASALSTNAEWLATLPREILVETDFSDTGKILDILKQRKIILEQAFASSGHQSAVARCRSYYAASGVVREQFSNVGYYQFLCDLIEHFDERARTLPEKLADVARRLFDDGGCLISFAGSDEDYARFWSAGPGCGQAGGHGALLEVPKPVMLNEAFVVPSDVCYAALGWDFRLLGQEYSGSWAVATRALTLDYLWNEVRVKGGAYGVGFQTLRSGNVRFHSYRDPHLDETLERFKNASEWLSRFEPTQREFEGYVVASTAAFDAPSKPRDIIRRQATEYLAGRTPEQRLEIRRQMVESSVEEARAFSEVVSDTVSAGAKCAFGNREIIESSSAGLKVVNLVG